MENTALLLIVLTNAVLVLILGALSFLINKLFRQSQAPKSDMPPLQYHPEAMERLKEIEKLKAKAKRIELFCPNHPEEPGEVSCSICDKLYCRTCAKPFKTMHFCKEHLPLIMNREWDEILTLKTSTQDPENGVKLYDLKKELFEKEDVTTFIETHYKINVDHDHIETYLVLFGIKENVPQLKVRFANFLNFE